MFPIHRLTLIYFARPRSFIDKEFNWEDFDLEQWSSDEYQWDKDDWYGREDYVSKPQVTIDTGKGDCDDYGLVALSYLYQTTDHSLEIANLWAIQWPPVGHIITYDKDTETVYSSGDIIDKTLEEYAEDSIYDTYFTRTVR